MPVSESVAAAAIFASLASNNYGGPLTPGATASLQTLANAAAKCISHFAAQNSVSTSVSGTVTGAVPSPPTPGVFNGSGTGTIAGLVKGNAFSGVGLAGEIMAELESGDYGGPLTSAARLQMAALADAIAVFADYVMANATVATTDTGAAITPGVNGPTTGTGTGSAA